MGGRGPYDHLVMDRGENAHFVDRVLALPLGHGLDGHLLHGVIAAVGDANTPVYAPERPLSNELEVAEVAKAGFRRHGGRALGGVHAAGSVRAGARRRCSRQAGSSGAGSLRPVSLLP